MSRTSADLKAMTIGELKEYPSMPRGSAKAIKSCIDKEAKNLRQGSEHTQQARQRIAGVPAKLEISN